MQRHGFVRTFCAIVALALLGTGAAQAQSVLFDFDAGPVHAPLPLDQVAGGITGHFTATGEGYAIQPADTLGFTPIGFAGNCIYPSSVFPADLLIAFDHDLTDISLLYAPEEYTTDSSATLRITAYLGANLVGTNTATAAVPGTWPSATLAFTSAQPFDNVVVHYDAPPPTGGDYGPIFMVDDVLVTPAVVPEPGAAAATAAMFAALGLARRAR
jgi:hypothetical protein